MSYLGCNMSYRAKKIHALNRCVARLYEDSNFWISIISTISTIEPSRSGLKAPPSLLAQKIKTNNSTSRSSWWRCHLPQEKSVPRK